MDDRGEATSEARETVDLSRLSLSFPLYPTAFGVAALLKLLVEGNCLIFVWEGGILDPWILTTFPVENTDPNGVVAR
jgi:hypothetical protein